MRPLGRRAALTWGPAALLLPGAGAAVAAPLALRFRILRGGSQVGTHAVTVTEEGARRVARAEVDIAVRLAGFTVYRYTHRFAETWAGDRLRAVESRSERNGTTTVMQARAEGAAVVVAGPDGTVRLPAEVAPLSWWDPGTLRRPLFDVTTGRPLRVRAERLEAAGGGFRWRLSGDAEGEATYDRAGVWFRHAMRGEDGSAVTFERA